MSAQEFGVINGEKAADLTNDGDGAVDSSVCSADTVQLNINPKEKCKSLHKRQKVHHEPVMQENKYQLSSPGADMTCNNNVNNSNTVNSVFSKSSVFKTAIRKLSFLSSDAQQPDSVTNTNRRHDMPPICNACDSTDNTEEDDDEWNSTPELITIAEFQSKKYGNC